MRKLSNSSQLERSILERIKGNPQRYNVVKCFWVFFVQDLLHQAHHAYLDMAQLGIVFGF